MPPRAAAEQADLANSAGSVWSWVSLGFLKGEADVGLGQNETTRNWTAGLSPCLHLLGTNSFPFLVFGGCPTKIVFLKKASHFFLGGH